MALTADAFLAKVQLRIGYDPSPKLTSADLLSIADDALTGDLWPMLIRQHGDYYRHALDYAITADQRRYRLPMKAHSNIADVLYVDEQGNEYSINAMEAEDVGHQGNRYWPPVNAIVPGPNIFTHYIEGDFVFLYPTPSATFGTLRVKYYRQPNSLVLSASAAQVVRILLNDSGFDKLTTSSASLPVGWSSDSTVDLIGGGNAHQVLAPDLDVNSIATVTGVQELRFLVGTLPTDLGSERDLSAQLISPFGLLGYVALVGQTPIVQCPDALQPLLIARTAQDALDSIGDAEGFQRAMERTQRLEAAAVPERSKAEP
jgi:hypothetical protein